MLNKEVKIIKNSHILLAQKPDINQVLISHYLTQAGYQVYETRCACDILEQLQSVQTDAILLDVNFPELESYKKQINNFAENKNIPVLFICNSKDIKFRNTNDKSTSDDHRADDSTAINPSINHQTKDWSADKFITHPINQAQLLTIIKSHIQKTQRHKKSMVKEVGLTDLFYHAPIAIVSTDQNLNVNKTNFQFFLQFGYEENVNKLSQIFNHSTHKNSLTDKQLLSSILNDGKVECEIETQHKNGTISWSYIRGKLLNSDKPELGLIWTLDDITQRKAEQQKTHNAATVFEGSGDSMMIIDDAGLIERINPALQLLTGYVTDELSNRPISILFDSTKNNQCISYILSLITHKKQWTGECWLRKKNGLQFPARMIINLVKRPDSSISHFVAVLSDISEGKAQELELKYRANHDPLTGLPNRNEFFVRLNEALATAKRLQYCIALLYLDLDGFKPINDTLGHGKGDEVLQQVAVKLQQCIRNVDTVARLGGDEFAIILNGTSDGMVTETASRLIHSLTMRFESSLQLSVSIGIAVFPNDSINPHKLLQYADKAMYKAKQMGKQSYCWHNAQL